MKESAKFVKVDIDRSMEIARKFMVSTVPTMMKFKVCDAPLYRDKKVAIEKSSNSRI